MTMTIEKQNAGAYSEPSAAFLGSPTQRSVATTDLRWNRIEMSGEASAAFLGSPTQGYACVAERMPTATLAAGVRSFLMRIGRSEAQLVSLPQEGVPVQRTKQN